MLGNFQSRGYLLIRVIHVVGQGNTVLVVGAGRSCLGIFFSSIIPLVFLPSSGRRSDIV